MGWKTWTNTTRQDFRDLCSTQNSLLLFGRTIVMQKRLTEMAQSNRVVRYQVVFFRFLKIEKMRSGLRQNRGSLII